MFKKLHKSNPKGFTIVEVMFVLAIAALIMLIVFLAVPALQRNSRNTGRKSDAGRINSSIANFVSNNNGILPRTDSVAHWQADCAAILADAGTMSQYTAANVKCTGAALGSAGQGKFNAAATGGGTFTAPTSLDQSDSLVFVVKATCPATSGAPSISPGVGNTRQAVLLYTVETGSGYVWNCETVD
jgi:prepilin-type N-terminal cleavage/methylation domain-containing protein